MQYFYLPRITAKWRLRRFCSTFNYPGLLQNGGFAVFAVLLTASDYCKMAALPFLQYFYPPRITAKWRLCRFCSTFTCLGLLQNGGFAVFAVLLLASDYCKMAASPFLQYFYLPRITAKW
ncbi:MAG: hypothetical protein IJS22_05990, partial [Lachnospiraceae bacterium]|nr:hypothetical protein [Lachnospiraceae bacterium]